MDNLLAIDSEDSEESAMEAAISSAPREMRDTVSRRHEELKACRCEWFPLDRAKAFLTVGMKGNEGEYVRQ